MWTTLRRSQLVKQPDNRKLKNCNMTASPLYMYICIVYCMWIGVVHLSLVGSCEVGWYELQLGLAHQFSSVGGSLTAIVAYIRAIWDDYPRQTIPLFIFHAAHFAAKRFQWTGTSRSSLSQGRQTSNFVHIVKTTHTVYQYLGRIF